MSEDETRLEALHELVAEAHRSGMPAPEFWRRFDELAGDLVERVDDPAAPDYLLPDWCAVLANADEAGYGAPELLARAG